MKLRWVVAACLSLALSAPSAIEADSPDTFVPPTTGATSLLPAFSHVYVVIMENHSLDLVLRSGDAPSLMAMARQGAVAANYFGVAHPSEPNYLALIGGDTFGVNSDSTSTMVQAPTVVDQLEANQHSWKAYMEGIPSVGSQAPYTNVYAKKHNPFVLFSTVVSSTARLQQVVPLTQLSMDLAANQAPDYSFIVPDMCHDMHDCSVRTGDTFLGGLVQSIQDSPAWDGRSVIFVTFDESQGGDDRSCCGPVPGGGRIGLIALSSLVRAGFVSQQPYNHYSLLRTIQDSWQLGPLGRSGDPATAPMTDLFGL